MKRLIGIVATIVMAHGGAEACGQVLQLPSFDYFSVQTSVMAPDRGGTYLGGRHRSWYGRRNFGVPGGSGIPGVGPLLSNRATGGGAGAGAASVHTTIMDHEALDRAVLSEAARRRAPGQTRLQGAEVFRPGRASLPAEPSGLMSVAELRHRNAQRNQAQQKEALKLLAQGDEAQAQGSSGAAKIYYQMALRRADSQLQPQIAQRLKRLAGEVK